ncbi:MAG: glycosyltransferase family 4 protein [Patescibacteria group bacterium]
MNICFIGKHKYPKDIFSNEQDLKTWRSLSGYFNKLFVIVESPDLLFHFGRENNIQIYLLPRLGYPGFILFAVVLGFYLNLRYGVDVFDASEIAGGGVAATILKFLTGIPTVIEIQGEIFRKIEKRENLKSQLLKKIGCFEMKRAARARVISHAIFNQVREQEIPAEKIRLVSLRVDLNLFNPNLWVSDTYKSGDRVGITLGYIGRLIKGKGLEDLFEAIAILKSQNLKFNCLIFGTGPLEMKLKKLAENLNISDKMEWRGFVPYSEVPAALAQIDIFVYPSWHEGFGRSIMEALAMEKAVVATRVGGIPDLIKDGENGFLVEPHNPTALAGKIKELMENKDLREKFGKAGRKWVSQNYEWKDGIKKFADLFLELKK